MNCESGNDSSIFVSEIIRISISEVTSDTNVSNLFRIELMFIWAIIGFWGYLKRDVFKPSITSSLFSVLISEELHYFSFGFEFQSGVNFSEYKRTFSARIEKPTEFRCKPSRCKRLWVILSYVM